MFRTALQWDPENATIHKELSELLGEEDKSGVLGGIFKKKPKEEEEP
jgi:hypothetical protein